MRLGLIGDVHAEDELLVRALAALRDQRVDRVLCTGNLVDGRGDVDRACRLLAEADALVVRGNHDRWIRSDEMRSVPHAHTMTRVAVETIAFLKGLPVSSYVDTPAGKLLLCHGIGGNDMGCLGDDARGIALARNEDLLALLLDPSVTFMVGGHTRQPMVRRFERGSGRAPLIVVNPGTLVRDEAPGFSVLDLAARTVARHVLEPDATRHESTRAL